MAHRFNFQHLKEIFLLTAVSVLFAQPFLYSQEQTLSDERKRETLEEAEKLDKELVEEDADDIFEDEEPKKWSVNWSYTLRYDDNVTLQPEQRRLQRAATQNERDWYHIFNAGLSYDAWSVGEHGLTIGLRGYQSVYDRHDELTLAGVTPYIAYSWKHSPSGPGLDSWVLFVPLSYSHYWLDQKPYMGMLSVSPTAFWQQTDRWVGVYRFSYRYFNYNQERNSADTAAGTAFRDSDRDANDYSLSIGEWYMFDTKKVHRLEWAVEGLYEDPDRQSPNTSGAANAAQGRSNFWAYRSFRPSLTYRLQLPDFEMAGQTTHVQMDLGGSWEARQYLHPNPIITHHNGIAVQQRDQRTVLSATFKVPFKIQEDIGDGIPFKMNVSLNYQFIDNKSNSPDEDYRRHFVGLTIGGTF